MTTKELKNYVKIKNMKSLILQRKLNYYINIAGIYIYLIFVDMIQSHCKDICCTILSRNLALKMDEQFFIKNIKKISVFESLLYFMEI